MDSWIKASGSGESYLLGLLQMGENLLGPLWEGLDARMLAVALVVLLVVVVVGVGGIALYRRRYRRQPPRLAYSLLIAGTLKAKDPLHPFRQ